MFSVRQKRMISDQVQKILRDTNHPELPPEGEEIPFMLLVNGKASWSWAQIVNNGAVQVLNAILTQEPSVNPWNESQDKQKGGD